MSKWISLNKAAFKYGVDENDVRTWIQVGEIASVTTEKTILVDDETIQEFLNRTQTLPTKEYIYTLKQLNENLQEMVESYIEIISMQQTELDLQKKEIALFKKMQEAMNKQNNCIKEIIHK